MKILALEFSSPQRSVAVATAPDDGTPRRLATVSEIQNPKSEVRAIPVLSLTNSISVSEVVETGCTHTMKPLGMAEEALKQAGIERGQIECLAIGLGPGSYNGIRAAIALAQGWQLACGIKLLGVSSTECIAAQAQADGLRGEFAVVIDAQREEFYLARYKVTADEVRELSALRLVTLAAVRKLRETGAVLIGPEATRWFPEARIVVPRAATLGRLALGRTDFVAGEKLKPIYLRETKFVKAPPPRVFAI